MGRVQHAKRSRFAIIVPAVPAHYPFHIDICVANALANVIHANRKTSQARNAGTLISTLMDEKNVTGAKAPVILWNKVLETASLARLGTVTMWRSLRGSHDPASLERLYRPFVGSWPSILFVEVEERTSHISSGSLFAGRVGWGLSHLATQTGIVGWSL
ncbi:MAG: hypothetical protein R3E66_00740 [bacterium]